MTSSFRSAPLEAWTSSATGGILSPDQAPGRIADAAWPPLRRATTFAAAPAPEWEEIRRRAEQEAAELLAAARLEAERLTAAAADEGYRAGYAEGAAAGESAVRADNAEALDRLAAIVESARRESSALFHAVEAEAVGLALAVAQAVVQQALRADPWLVVRTIAAAVERIGAERVVRLRLSPGDAALMQARAAEAGLRPEWQVVGDPSTPPGGCVVESAKGFVDVRPETLMAEIAERFAAVGGWGERNGRA